MSPDVTETDDCLFCRIAAGAVPADVVASTERAVAFRDLSPQAPTHVLVVPRAHHADVGSLADADGDTLTDVLRLAARVGREAGDHRVVFNTGTGAGQSVFHVHAHVLAGRSLGWPPG